MPHITNLTPFQNGTSQRQVSRALLVFAWYCRLSFGLWKTRRWTHNSLILFCFRTVPRFYFFCATIDINVLMKRISYYVFRLQYDTILWVVCRCTTTRTIRSCVFVWVPFNLPSMFEISRLVLANFIAVVKQQGDKAKCNFETPLLLFLSQIERISVLGKLSVTNAKKDQSKKQKAEILYQLFWKVSPSCQESTHLAVKCLAPGGIYSRKG